MTDAARGYAELVLIVVTVLVCWQLILYDRVGGKS